MNTDSVIWYQSLCLSLSSTASDLEDDHRILNIKMCILQHYRTLVCSSQFFPEMNKSRVLNESTIQNSFAQPHYFLPLYWVGQKVHLGSRVQFFANATSCTHRRVPRPRMLGFQSASSHVPSLLLLFPGLYKCYYYQESSTRQGSCLMLS